MKNNEEVANVYLTQTEWLYGLKSVSFCGILVT